MNDDKIIRFPKGNCDKDNELHHIVLSSVLNDDDSSNDQSQDENGGAGIDFDVIPPIRNFDNSTESSYNPEKDVIDVEFKEPSNPLNFLLSFIIKGMNKHLYMYKDEVMVKKKKSEKIPEAEEKKEAEQHSDSSADVITKKIVDENNIYIFEDLIRENDLEKIKLLFHNNDKLKDWVKTSYPIYRLPKEVLDIIDGKEDWCHHKQAIVSYFFIKLLACFFM